MSGIVIIRVGAPTAPIGSTIWKFCTTNGFYATKDTSCPPAYVGGLLISVPVVYLTQFQAYCREQGAVLL